MPLAAMDGHVPILRIIAWNISTHTAWLVSIPTVKLHINLVTTLAESRPSDLHRMIP